MQHFKSISAVLTSALIQGMLSGYILTFFSVQMERAEIPTRIIGFANSSQTLAIVLVTLFLPYVLYKVRLHLLHRIAVIGGIFALVMLYHFFETIPAHMGLRLILGCGVASSYILYEYWLNSCATDDHRGKVMALYGMFVVIGMGAGPLLVPYVDPSTWQPYGVGIAMLIACHLPILFVRKLSPKQHETPPSASVMGIIKLSPTIAVAGVMFGITESSIFAFVPIYGLREGLSEEQSVLLMTCIFWGGIAMQFPIGWLSDKFSPRFTLFLATGIGAVGGAILPYLISTPNVALWAHMLIWGGVVTTIYTIATIVLGHEHKEANLANATIAFVMTYGIGSVIGPTLSGEAIATLGTQGLPWVMGLACAVTFVFTAWRTWKGHAH